MLFKTKSKKKTAKLPKRISGRWAVAQVWLKRFGMGVAVIVLIAWGGAWLWLSGAVERAGEWSQKQVYDFTQDMGFTVANIMVEGRVNTDPHILFGLINMQEGDPIFAFDPFSAQEQIQRITWVKDVTVERRLPDTIYVNLQERDPLALFHNGKKLLLLDQDGEAITDHNLKRFEDLVLISGKNGAANAPNLITSIMAEPILYPLIESASRISDRRWDLKLKNDMTIQLPEEGMSLALSRLALAHKRDALLDKKIKAIDLRLSDRMIIRTYPGDVQDYKVNFNTYHSNKL